MVGQLLGAFEIIREYSGHLTTTIIMMLVARNIASRTRRATARVTFRF